MAGNGGAMIEDPSGEEPEEEPGPDQPTEAPKSNPAAEGQGTGSG